MTMPVSTMTMPTMAVRAAAMPAQTAYRHGAEANRPENQAE
jgi:hypothetical protein